MSSDSVPPNMTTHGGVLYYVVKVPKHQLDSVESGWDNPFRPGGDLSREADEIVELIKGGKPITPTPGQQPPPLETSAPDGRPASFQEPITESPKKAAAPAPAEAAPRSSNGTARAENGPPTSAAPGAVVVQRGTVKPEGGDASQVEHVTIKKKPKCKCCVIQ